MKKLLLILMTMNAGTLMAQDGKATTVKKTFNRTTNVSTFINADASIVWTLLTNASDYPRWNSTIISIEGEIMDGEKIKLKSTLDSTRTFKLKVKQFEADSLLVWGDGKGSRTYTIMQSGDGITFTMTEKIGGLMFPMYSKYIPSFDESFDQFAKDLKNEAEIISQTK